MRTTETENFDKESKALSTVSRSTYSETSPLSSVCSTCKLLLAHGLPPPHICLAQSWFFLFPFAVIALSYLSLEIRCWSFQVISGQVALKSPLHFSFTFLSLFIQFFTSLSQLPGLSLFNPIFHHYTLPNFECCLISHSTTTMIGQRTSVSCSLFVSVYQTSPLVFGIAPHPDVFQINNNIKMMANKTVTINETLVHWPYGPTLTTTSRPTQIYSPSSLSYELHITK